VPRITVNGFKTHYQQSGQGPDVVLIHAFTSNLAVWMLTNIVETLAADFRVTAYDLRGHGASDVPQSGYTSLDLTGDLKQLHEALGLGPAWLVGHSYGGVIGMHAALVHPEIVSGVILADTYFPGLRHLEPDMGQAGPWKDLRASLLAAGTEIGPKVDFARLFRTAADWDSEQLSTVRRELGAPAARWMSQLAQLAGTTAAEEAFHVAGLTAERICAVGQPVVALYDEHSPFKATRQYLTTHLSCCQADVVPGAGHLAPVQNPTAFAALVHKHLRKMAPQCAS
jgi:pimeloyl-ACP methyl ester carboxylesterase